MFLQVGGGFLDSFLKAQQATGRIAHSILNFGFLQLQQEQLKEKQKQAKEAAEAVKTVLGVSVQELQQAQGELTPQAQGALNLMQGIQQGGVTGAEAKLALPQVQEAVKQQRAAQQAVAEQERAVAQLQKAISAFKLPPEQEAVLLAAMTAPDVPDTFRNRVALQILGPTESQKLTDLKKRLDIQKLQRDIRSDEAAMEFLRQRGVQLPEGVVLNGAADLVQKITLRDLERPDEIFDRYIKFLTQNDSLQIGFTDKNIYDDPEAFQTITDAFIDLHAPMFGREDIVAAISTGPLTPAMVKQIGQDVSAGKSEQQILQEIEAAFNQQGLAPVFRSKDARAAARALIKRIQRGTRRP